MGSINYVSGFRGNMAVMYLFCSLVLLLVFLVYLVPRLYLFVLCNKICFALLKKNSSNIMFFYSLIIGISLA